MKTPYERLIHFCEAEVESRTKDWVSVRREPRGFYIEFVGLGMGVTILDPEYAAQQDEWSRDRYGSGHEDYADQGDWTTLCHMLGLNSPWIPCSDRLPEIREEVRVFGADRFQRDSANIDHIASDGKVIWVDDFGFFHATHWMPKVADPT